MAANQVLNLSGDGGVLKEVMVEGTGEATPSKGSTVSMHYCGKFPDGKQFDSSLERNEPFEFELGKGRVIKAFDMGVQSMKLGEKCKLTCAPEYAYGVNGAPPSIPPNATLIFELEMLGWKNEDISPNQDGSIERIILEASNKVRSPQEGSEVKAHLIGSYNGKVFEDREIVFSLGEGSEYGVVDGVEIALKKMVVGEQSKIIIKSKHAFGQQGNEAFQIPPDATVEYIINLVSCSKPLEEWKLTDDERISESKQLKEKGTNYFKKGNNKLAIKLYTKCIEILPDQSDLDEVKDLKVMAYSNIALCYQKCNDNFEGKIACNKALSLNPKFVKALYRRGQCELATGDFEEAIEDFKKVLELEATNKSALSQIQICKAKMKEAKSKEKRLYANMFSKLAVGEPEEPVNTDDDVLSKCGEWSEEDGERGADLAFEKDDNIVMI